MTTTAGGTRSISSKDAYADQAWHHVALERTGGLLLMYVDGAFVASGPDAPGSVSQTVSFQIQVGQRLDNVYRFDGTLDEVRIYNRALSRPSSIRSGCATPTRDAARYCGCRSTRCTGVVMRKTLIVGAVGLLCAAGAVTAAAGPSQPERSSAVACAAGTTTPTTSGPVCGIVAKGDAEWLGVPYAAPARRDAALGVAPTAHPVDGDPAGDGVRQPVRAGLLEPDRVRQRGLPVLDVTRPNDGTQNLPVLVHFHG